MSLTKKQKRAARTLRRHRPAVLPDTNVIIGDADRSAYYRRVTRAMHQHKITDADVTTFCDMCGVPD